MSQENLITIRSAVDVYDLNESSLRSAIREGRIDSIKDKDGIILIDPAEVKAWMKTKRNHGKKKQMTIKKKTEKFVQQTKSRVSSLLAVIVKVYGELAKMENSLPSQNQIVVNQLKNEILKVISGLDL